MVKMKVVYKCGHSEEEYWYATDNTLLKECRKYRICSQCEEDNKCATQGTVSGK